MIVYECSICGHYHPWEWSGDCRENDTRYSFADLETFVYDDEEIEFRSMTDRLIADGVYSREEGIRIAAELGDFVTD